MRHVITAALVVCASLTLEAQQPSAPALALGDAPGSWVADVTTTGGYTGRGAGSVHVRADGATACGAPLACGAAVSGDAFQRIAAALQAARGIAWERPATRTVCNDCIVTTLTVHTRQADGSEAVTTYVWDNSDAAQVPREVRAMYDSIMGIARR
jgi:hypothetical protein